MATEQEEQLEIYRRKTLAELRLMRDSGTVSKESKVGPLHEVIREKQDAILSTNFHKQLSVAKMSAVAAIASACAAFLLVVIALIQMFGAG